MFNQPAILHALLDHLTGALINYVGYQIEAGAQVVQLFDSWAHHLSPEQFAEFSLPYANRIVEAVRAKYPHVPLIFHANGGELHQQYKGGAGCCPCFLLHRVSWHGRLSRPEVEQRPCAAHAISSSRLRLSLGLSLNVGAAVQRVCLVYATEFPRSHACCAFRPRISTFLPTACFCCR